jgi:hypothetical protein
MYEVLGRSYESVTFLYQELLYIATSLFPMPLVQDFVKNLVKSNTITLESTLFVNLLIFTKETMVHLLQITVLPSLQYKQLLLPHA